MIGMINGVTDALKIMPHGVNGVMSIIVMGVYPVKIQMMLMMMVSV